MRTLFNNFITKLKALFKTEAQLATEYRKIILEEQNKKRRKSRVKIAASYAKKGGPKNGRQ